MQSLEPARGASPAILPDQNVALAALGAEIHITGTKGERTVPISKFYLLPGDTPERETVLEPGELVTAITLPPLPAGAKSLYLKLRDRASYEFALASAAIIVKRQGAHIDYVRIALGGVGTVPWRSSGSRSRIARQGSDYSELPRRC